MFQIEKKCVVSFNSVDTGHFSVFVFSFAIPNSRITHRPVAYSTMRLRNFNVYSVASTCEAIETSPRVAMRMDDSLFAHSSFRMSCLNLI